MLPKFDDVAISTYLIVFAKMRRPSTTPSASTPRSLSSKMMSAASLATSVPLSTEIPTSAWCSATASLTPSPRNATSAPPARCTRTMRAFVSGPTRANTVVCVDGGGERVVVHRVDRGARQRARTSRPSSRQTVTRDLLAVAGDDLDVDAEAREPRERRGRARLWVGR